MYKKLLRIIISLTLIATLVFPTIANATYLLISFGDVNTDGFVDIGDVARMRAYIIGTYTPDNIEDFKTAADTNEDNSVDIVDVAVVRSVIVGNTQESVCGLITHEDGNEIRINDQIIVTDSQVVGTLPSGVSYKDGVLTLNNAKINIDSQSGAGIFCDDDLTIELIGNNTITSSNPQACGILTDGSLNIGGTGKLTVSGMTEGTAILSIQNLSINNVEEISITKAARALFSSNECEIDYCKFTVSEVTEGIVAIENFSSFKSDISISANYPMVFYTNSYFTGTNLVLKGLSGIICIGGVDFCDSTVDINAYGDNSTDSEFTQGIGIFTNTGIELAKTYGAIEGNTCAVLVDGFADQSVYLIFTEIKTNVKYKYYPITEEYEGHTYKYIVVTYNDPMFEDGMITNAIARLELERP